MCASSTQMASSVQLRNCHQFAILNVSYSYNTVVSDMKFFDLAIV